MSNYFTSSVQKIKDYIDNHYFIYKQSTPEQEWTINHNLNKYPSVTIIDSAGNLLEGEIDYIDKNNLKIKLSSAVSGKAYLN